MKYIILFLEGIITFISPCILPMIPVYISYFAAGRPTETSSGKRRAFINALGFVTGFTVLFTIMGAFAGTLGKLLNEYSSVVNIVSGLIVIIFGLNISGIFKIPFLNNAYQKYINVKDLGFFSSLIFGVVFAVGWTPCVGSFLGSALMLASIPASALQGAFMLLIFSTGLGVPFLICAVIIDRLKSAFGFIKRNYKIINIASGTLLIIIGILMMTGYMGYFLALLSF